MCESHETRWKKAAFVVQVIDRGNLQVDNREPIMTTITLPADIEASLAEEARRRGTTPEAVALDSLRKLFIASSIKNEPGNSDTLFDFLNGFMGTVHGVAEPFSEKCGERFAEGL